MPLIESGNPMAGTIEPPTKEPFIGILTRWEPPTYKPAILPGTHFAMFGDPKHPDASFRWVFVSMSPNGKAINLKCDCTVPGCTRTVRYTAKYAGIHPNRQR